jgi:hypothetical protein
VVLLALAGVAALGIGLATSPIAGTLSPIGQVLVAILRTIAVIACWPSPSASSIAGYPSNARCWPTSGCRHGHGRAIWLASEVFGLLAPLLVRQLAVFGVFVSLLALLIWLGWVTQLLIMGGSWSRVRRDQREALSLGESRSDDRSEPWPRAADRS